MLNKEVNNYIYSKFSPYDYVVHTAGSLLNDLLRVRVILTDNLSQSHRHYRRLHNVELLVTVNAVVYDA